MYSKSRLLEIIISRCEVSGRSAVSVNKFYAEVLKFLDEGRCPSDISEKDRSEINGETQALRKLFAEKNVNVSSSLIKMEEYLKSNKEGFLESLLFDKILTEISMSAVDAEQKVSCEMICRRILESPTEAVRLSVVPEEQKTETEEPEQGESDARSRLAAIRRLLGSKLDTEHTESGDKGGDIRASAADDEDDDEDEDDEEESEEQPVKFKKVPDTPHTMSELMDRVQKVHTVLTENIYGQDHAIATFVSGFFQSELTATVFEKRDKPRATFLFAGPPGVGKTFLSEKAAEALGLPFMRFDMSEYTDKESNLEFCGSDKVYKNGSEGNVTGFVAKNPKCVLLFDEIEKAHISVIYLFLQMLDAGRLRDNFTDKEVSFTDAIIIFTTNAGRRMYEDESINLLTTSQKAILKALSSEVNPETKVPLFPPAICSRFASGNVVMFNRMGSDFLLKIAEREMRKHCDGISEKMGIKVSFDNSVPYAVLFAEGGKADARTIKAKSAQFIHDELYELFRLMKSQSKPYDVANLKSVNFCLTLPDDSDVKQLFENYGETGVLVFTDKAKCRACSSLINGVKVHCADTLEGAKEILETQEISLVLCDINYEIRDNKDILNCEDVDSLGMDFFDYAVNYAGVPVYLLDEHGGSFSKEEMESLSAVGASGVFDLSWSATKINDFLKEIASAAHLKKSMFELAKSNKVLGCGTKQKIDKQGDSATISLYDFRLSTAVDAEDNDGIIDGTSNIKTRFDDVIGAKDAKEELKYFIEYLKNPVKYIKKGIKVPKGILLYGPPGTGKTLLAKAVAGEAGVTFIRAEGNQFLKKFVGEGSESVHKLFATARKYAPSILFVDEIDAIAKDRQSGSELNNSSDVLTSFLTEMDGFNTDNDRPVFVLAATNFSVEKSGSRSLDPALLRRFDRRIYIDLPNREERTQYINMRVSKLKNQSLSNDAIENLALRSTGSSLAELDSVFELALRNIIKTEEGVLTDEILEDAFETFNSGEIKKWDESELLRTARHEAGHTVACWASGEKPSYLTIVARGSHGGYMQHGDSENKGLYTKSELLARVRTALGGRAAELVYYGDEDGLSSGASGDLQTATKIVQTMICNYGMDEKIGLCAVDLSEITNSAYYSEILNRINQRLKEELDVTKQIIANNKKAVDALVVELLEKNSLKGGDIEKILDKYFCK